MAIFAVIQLPTRIVRRLTTDATHTVDTDELLVETEQIANLAEGPWVLDVGGSVRKATPEEVDAADADPTLVASRRATVLANYLAACDDLATDGTVPAKYRTFFTLHAKVMRGLTR